MPANIHAKGVPSVVIRSVVSVFVILRTSSIDAAQLAACAAGAAVSIAG